MSARADGGALHEAPGGQRVERELAGQRVVDSVRDRVDPRERRNREFGPLAGTGKRHALPNPMRIDVCTHNRPTRDQICLTMDLRQPRYFLAVAEGETSGFALDTSFNVHIMYMYI